MPDHIKPETTPDAPHTALRDAHGPASAPEGATPSAAVSGGAGGAQEGADDSASDELLVDVLSAAIGETEERLAVLSGGDLATVEDLSDALRSALRREQNRRRQETNHG